MANRTTSPRVADASNKASRIFQAFATLRNEATAANRPVLAGKFHSFLSTFDGGDVNELARLFDLITESGK